MSTLRTAFLTPTWRGDLEQFRLLRRSMQRFGMGDLPHHALVQTEDLELFQPLRQGGLRLHATADVLPAYIEQGRRACLERSQGQSRRMARLRRSLNKRLGWFDWLRYSGWQIQQISKLQAASVFDEDIQVVLDSDMLFCDTVALEEFQAEGRAVLIEDRIELSASSPGLDFLWARTAHRLLGKPFASGQSVNGMLGTPFVLDREVVRALQRRLEEQNGRPWHETLLRQRLHSWSEFALYNAFADEQLGTRLVRHPRQASLASLVLYSEQHRRDAAQWIAQAFGSPEIRFLRIQSQARESAEWRGADLAPLLAPYLDFPAP